MDFAAFPPEIISGQMYSGPGAEPLLAAAAGWESLAGELQSTATGYSSAVAELTEAWQGPSAATMAAATAPYVSWLSTTAAQAKDAAARAAAAAGAYETAFTGTVPPPVIAANRSQLATLLATNVFGQNTAAIAALETQYAAMWLQNATTMNTYAAAAAAVPATPFAVPPSVSDPAGPAAQSAAAANAAATSTGAGASSIFGRFDSWLGGLAGYPSGTGLYEDLFAAMVAVTKTSTFANSSMSVPNLGMVQFKTFYKPAPTVVDIPASALGAALRTGTPPVIGVAGTVAAVSAGTGEANLVGRLSVPPAWATATPAIRLAATALPEAGLAGAAPAADTSRGLLAPMALGSLAGGALGGSAPRVLNATAGQVRGGASAGTRGARAPVQLDRVIAQLQKRPDSVRHWSVDQAGLDDLIAELSKKPGVHAVHLSGKK